jgi:DNA polymerase I-like protein with 3'-5' exonuclease and polymerase domains
VRGRFPFAKEPFVLCGGDFSSFEVTLADAAYHDPQLNADLRSGRKIHADMAGFLFGYTYEQVVAGVKAETTAALAEEAAAKAEGRDMRPVESRFTSMYNAGKQAVFALIYGGDFGTISRKLGVDERTASAAYFAFLEKYPKIAERRAQIQAMFCSMRQPGGIGSEIFWHEPHDYMESILGFRRYFTLENKICKALYNLAQELPDDIQKIKGRVQRRKWAKTPIVNKTGVVEQPGLEGKYQNVPGATQSAVYGAAFQIQSAAMRAASNHEIQSSGAEITKAVERGIWDVQPWGVSDWRVAPLNIHDEILSVTHPDYVDEVAEIVKNKVEYYRPTVPLIGMSWGKNLTSWADTH